MSEVRVVESTWLDLMFCGCCAFILPASAPMVDAVFEPCDTCGEVVRRYAINVVKGYPTPAPTVMALRPLTDRTAVAPPRG